MLVGRLSSWRLKKKPFKRYLEPWQSAMRKDLVVILELLRLVLVVATMHLWHSRGYHFRTIAKCNVSRGRTAAEIRGFRPPEPEPYKGKGIRYRDEQILRKEGKKK